MPATLPDSREGRLAKAHLKFVPEDDADDEFFAAAAGAFATRDCSGKNVRRVRRILLPVDVVVIHAADHESVGQRCGDGIETAATTEDGSQSSSGNFGENVESHSHVVLLIAAQRATERV